MAADTKQPVRPFGMADKIGYALGDFGNDFTFMLSSMFMMKFYTDVMGVAPGIVGGLMLAARFVDAVTDVTMGQIVDRSRPGRDGKFKPWIRRMCGPLGISAFLMFQSGLAGMPMGFKIFWMFFTYLLWGSVFYTSVNIPYGSMVSAVSADPNHRAQLSTYRSIGATMASLVIGTGTPLLAYEAAEGATVLSGSRMTLIAGVFAVCGIVCQLLCCHLVKERVEIPQNTSKLNAGKMAKSIAANRALLGMIAAAIMLLLGMLGMSGMAPFVFPVFYNSASAQSLSSLASNLAVLLICAPLAAKIAARTGKKELSAVSCLLSAAVWLACLAVRPRNPLAFVGFYAVSYIGIGMFNTVIWAMITDVIDDAEVKNGIREDGTIYSVYSFARKLGQALSSGMIGGLMTMIGYSDGVALDPSAYPQVLEDIFNLSCIIPAIGLAAAALSLFFIYPLSRKRVEENAEELARRRNA